MGAGRGTVCETAGMKILPPPVSLAQLPTPLEFAPRLTQAWGGPQIWIKRDDLTGFGLSGNKVRKLELHFAAADDADTHTMMTCGAVQSNHCRATAIASARLGKRCILFLRSGDGKPPADVSGNHLLQRLAGAEVHFITPKQYADRDAVMEAAAAELTASGEKVWILPEGASDELGMRAFESAFAETAAQITAQIGSATTIWHAASSAGTTAGLAVGAARRRVSHPSEPPHVIVGASVGDDSAYLAGRVRSLLDIWTEGSAPFEVIDEYIGGGYGRTTDEELAVQVEGSRLTGLIWDPTYTGKALYALHEEIRRGRFTSQDHVVFWHTGGGFAAFAHDFGGVLG